ncbi:ankyrin, partial [Amniculicola lignicola CBS 123094]
MTLLDLPLELFQPILDEAINLRRIQRIHGEFKYIVRLRLVCKTFATEVIASLIRTRLIDCYLCANHFTPQFAVCYAWDRIHNGPYDNLPVVRHLQEIASILHSRDSSGGRDYDYYLSTMCNHIINGQGASYLFTKYPIEYEHKRYGNGVKDQGIYNLITAGVYFNIPSIVREKMEVTTPKPMNLNTFLGSALEIAINTSNYQMLEMMPVSEYWGLSYAARVGNIDTFRFFLELCRKEKSVFHCGPPIATPNIEIWNEYMAARRTNKGGRLIDPIIPLRRAAEEGWTEMVEHILKLESIDGTNLSRNDPHTLFLASKNGQEDVVRVLLELGVNKEEVLCNAVGQTLVDPGRDTRSLAAAAAGGYRNIVQLLLNYDMDTTGSVAAAAGGGHRDVVELLLDHGAQTTGSVEAAARNGHRDLVQFLLDRRADTSESVAAAAARGYHSIVQLLLDHGAQADYSAGGNECSAKYPHPLLSAVRFEDTTLFKLLLEQGAILSPTVGRECMKLAREDGLDSMIELLLGLWPVMVRSA